jgi:hypothetical protein
VYKWAKCYNVHSKLDHIELVNIFYSNSENSCRNLPGIRIQRIAYLVPARQGTAQHSTGQGTARHGTARHGTARHGTARHRRTAQYLIGTTAVSIFLLNFLQSREQRSGVLECVGEYEVVC